MAEMCGGCRAERRRLQRNEALRKGYQKHKEKRKAASRKFKAERSPERIERDRERNKKWREDNEETLKEKAKMRYSAKQAWRLSVAPEYRGGKRVTGSGRTRDPAVLAVYEKAALMGRVTGRAYEVDHIIPVQHPLVCGLHNEANLQILPRKVNRKKSNKLPVALVGLINAPRRAFFLDFQCNSEFAFDHIQRIRGALPQLHQTLEGL